MCCAMYMCVFLCFAVVSIAAKDETEIKNLIGEPDYRQVRLHWDTEKSTTPENFEVKYCELQSWGPQRCRVQDVPQPEDNEIDVGDKLVSYDTDIKGLRMATTYSFEIRDSKEVREREDRSHSSGRNQNIIVIPTKGFSARATQCLSHASEIEVSTGPYFAGRIAVEAADGERCAIDGDPTSPRDSYTLRINHNECGSKVNETTVATFVIVQENLPILTHSTRRFLVICSYQPETLTVRAGLSLPTNHKGQAQLSPVNVDDEGKHSERRSRNFRIGRAYASPQALVQEKSSQTEYIGSNNIVAVFVMCLLSIAILIGILVTVYKISIKHKKCFDDVSISGFSVSTVGSCSTLAGSISEKDNSNSGNSV